MNAADLNSLIWNAVPEEEKKAFAVLAVPVWFDEELGRKLLAAFAAGPPQMLERVIRQRHVVFRYEERGWHLDDGLRCFLLEKSGEFGLHLPSVHALLITYYREAAQAEDCFGQQEYVYLRLYHQVQADVRTGLRAVFREYRADDGQKLRLPSLVRICETAPVKVSSEPEYRLLRIMRLLHFFSCGREELEQFRDELKELARETEDSVLAGEADRLLLAVLDRLPASKSNDKLRKKTEKRLEQEQADFSLFDEPLQPAQEEKGANKYLGNEVQKTVARIVRLHQQGQHDEAWHEATKGHLMFLQGEQKTWLCKSYCNIASQIKNVPRSECWQLQYFDLAAKANRFDPVALNGKANLLAKTGRLAEAITLYQSISGSIADQYTRCGQAFLLLQSNSGGEDIADALRLFAEAERREPLNLVALLGLWISHARLGNAEEAELFRRRFEDCQAAQERSGVFLSADDIAQKEAERQLEEIKCLITVWEMAQYQRVIDRAVPYALLRMSVRHQQRAFSFC